MNEPFELNDKNEQPKRKGTLLQSDDVQVNTHIAIHSLKDSDEKLPIFGIAIKVKAVELPFIVGLPVNSNGPAVLDVRQFNFMNVSEEFAKAQLVPKQPKGSGNNRLADLMNAIQQAQQQGDSEEG